MHCARTSIRLSVALIALTTTLAHATPAGFVKMNGGYFVDSATGKPFVPHGVAYQTWNRPLGVWQTPDQLRYDLDEMVKMGANSIRVDFVWQHIEEQGDNIFNWTNYDLLVQECDKRDLRIFALIGYQWPPNWFPNDWYTMHPPETDSTGIYHTNRWQSDIIGYETPQARAQYAEWIGTVCARYKDSKAIAGWIVGNESGYLGLWSGLLDGYDTNCESAFRTWCTTKYTTITNANATWGTAYANFSDIKFVDQYRAYGVEGAVWADMVQWREDSIAGFTAVGARAAKNSDTNHLISYSTVGMQWGEEDWRYHAEDRGRITAACLATNAALDFFSVNNYPWSMLGHESQNGHWGVSFTKKVTKIPVVYSETGFTSTETMWPGMNEAREGPLVRNSLWESLEDGAIGTHIFSWMDRPYITDREKGFGIVYADRGIKPAFWVSRNAFMLMEQANLSDLLMNSKDPTPDMAFLWTDAVDSQHNRYECEMQQIAGALQRLGYEPNFINLADLGSGAYTNYKVIILPRNMRVENTVPGSGGKSILDYLRTVVIPAGVNIMASADIPGLQNFNGKQRSQFVAENQQLFGIDATDIGGFEAPMRTHYFVSSYWSPITVQFTTNALGSVSGGYTYRPYVWKYSDEVTLSTGGVVWATMDSGRNKGFEDSTNIVAWNSWMSSGSTAAVNRTAGLPLAGTNALELSGRDAGVWADFPVVPFGHYTANTYLRSMTGNPLQGGSVASFAIEWYGEKDNYLGKSCADQLGGSTPGGSWVKYAIDSYAPSNAFKGRRIIRIQPTNLVVNSGLTGSGAQPTSWFNWGDVNHDAEYGSYLGSNGNSWAFWQDGGLFQDITNGFGVGDTLQFGGWLYTPDWDQLKNGTKQGVFQVEFYNGAAFLSSATATPAIQWGSTSNTWVPAQGSVVVPTNTTIVRIIARCLNPADGSGRFFADDAFVRNTSRGAGAVFADNISVNPAVVVKNFGAAKSAIFLYSAGDNSPDSVTDIDLQPDTGPWKYRYDIFGAIVRDYFGVQPKLSCSGTNAFLCLPEYRTTSNNNVLIQMKNYLYDTNFANGGANLDFTLSSSLLTGKTIRAYEQGKILAQNSSGTITVSLPPDGQEILYAYTPVGGTSAVPQVCQISDAPSLVHPFGDKVYTLKVKYDCLARTDLRVRIAFQENGDNGDGITNEIYQVLTNTVAGNGEQWFYMWIPDANQGDTDYKSTPDGGKYQFNAWLETTAGVSVAQAVPVPTRLEWGVRPTNALPSTLTQGATVPLNLEWEDLYESLDWKNTPESRNDAYPGRVAVYRSTKTEGQFPGHLAKVNEVCDWLETLGYPSANPLDIGFDNVVVQGLFTNDFNNGGVGSWTRAAGAYNWGNSAPTNGYLRLWRIGNDDNFLLGPTNQWGAVTVSSDVRYNTQDNYFDDIELFPKYVDRNNYYLVGIRNFYGFWKLRYIVRVNGYIQQQGWIYSFDKTNQPGAGTWYNLKVASSGATNDVYFNSVKVGTFFATNFPTARIALGTKASQLGIWDPQKGYYFIDDDENGYSADPNTNGPPLNMDWGYLNQFYRTMVLPGVYTMNDKEASNLVTWAQLGLNNILSTDGGVAMRDETGATDLGRVEQLFGVSPVVGSISGITKLTVGTNDHYVTLDYPAGAQIAASGAGRPYTTLTRGLALATVTNSSLSPALIVNTITNNAGAPGKAITFNFAADSSGQLTNGLRKLAQRSLEWLRNDAYKVRVELKYVNPLNNPSLDLLVYATNAWVLSGTGVTNVMVNLPSDGLMTGDNKFYWAMYTYPWDATNAWLAHDGFYSSGNDTLPLASLAGKGIEILGVTDKAFAGRDWDIWASYNTRTTTWTVTYGIKKHGSLQDEDNFNSGSLAGWNIAPYSNIAWSVTTSSMQARVTASPFGYAYIYRNGLNLTGQNVTVEYDTLFTNSAFDGGVVYRGRVLYVNPNLCGWADDIPAFYTTNRPVTGTWNHVVINIRDGVPYQRSDLLVNGRVVFLSEPIQTASWTTNTFGFLSPYSNVNAVVQWDNVRVADEQYSLVYTNVVGEYVPTGTNPTFWGSVPDYDPDMLEHDGTAGGARYDWYVYARGEGFHSYKEGGVYFAPRLMVESANFPTNLSAGTNVVVPVQWESLSVTQVPARLRVRLFDAFSGAIYVDQGVLVTAVAGSTNVAVTVPSMPPGSNYVWTAFMHPTNAIDAWKERIGADDTFRFNEVGIGLAPETRVTMSGGTVLSGVLPLYSDAGILAGSSIFTWQGSIATFNGNFVDLTAPEGSMSFFTTGTLWQGWGIFEATNLSAYAGGYVKFWAKSTTQLKVDLEGPQGVKGTQYIPSTTNLWKQFILPVSGFVGVQLANMYGLFEITGESAGAFYIDNVRWDLVNNRAPVAYAGLNQTITLPSVAALTGTATDDGLPSNILTVAWSKVSGPGTVTFSNAAAQATAASFSASGVYVLQLLANDSQLTATSTVQITVNPASPVNQAPAVSAGIDQTITMPAPVVLAGAATDDGLPSGILNVSWTKVSGPGTVTFTNTATANTRATFSASGVYVLRLIASDTALASTDDVQVTVNQAPVVSAGVNQTITLPSPATLAGTATDDGLPSGILNVSWTKVSGPGTVTFTNAATANTQARFTTNGVYVLQLVGSDTLAASTSTVQLTVNPAAPVNQAPVVNAGVDQTITLPSTVAIAGTATDDGLPSGILNVSWTKVSGPGTVTFTNATTANTRASFSTNGVYVLRLIATDTALSSTDDVQVTVNAAAVNQAPVVNAGVDQTITLPATVAIAGTATDDGLPSSILNVSWTKLSGPGTVTFTNAATANTRANFTTNGVYVLRLIATDTALSSTDDVQVTVNAAAVNQAPVVNAGVDQTITLPSTVAIAGTATDDGLPSGIVNVSWTKLSGPGTVTFTNAATANTRASFSTNGVYVLRLSASDTLLTSTDDMQVTVNPAAGSSPTNPIVLTLNASAVTGTLAIAGQQDWYMFTAPATGAYTLVANGLTLTGGTRVALYGPNNYTSIVGAVVSQFVFIATSPGSYYVQISALYGTPTGAYTMQAIQGQPPYVQWMAIYNWAASTPVQAVTLTNQCVGNPTQYMASESPTFSGATWQTYSSNPAFTLSAGAGMKTVYFKVQNAFWVSPVYSDTIQYSPPATLTVNAAAVTGTLTFASQEDWYMFTAPATGVYTVVANGLTVTGGTRVAVYGPNSYSTIIGAWVSQAVFTATSTGTYYVAVSALYGTPTGTYTIQAIQGQPPYVQWMAINNWAASTPVQSVTLTNQCVGNPTQYMASESPTFSGATWQTYSSNPAFTLSAGAGIKTVYFKVQNAFWVSPVYSDTIQYSPPVTLTVNAAAVTGTLTFASQENWYMFTAPATGVYTVTANGLTVTGGTRVAVYGPNSYSTIIGAWVSQAVFTATSAGTYYVDVAALYGTPTGTYTIAVTGNISTNQTADLSVTSLLVTRPADAGLKSFTACSYNIVNGGPTPISNEWVMVEYYLSANTTFGDADDRKIGDTGFTLSIPSGATSPIVLTGLGLTNMVRFWSNNLVGAGAYYTYAKVSIPDGSPLDSNAGNNYAQAAAFTFTPLAADLTLTAMSVTRPADAGLKSFTACSYNIVNNGPTALTSEWVFVEYYLSSDSTFGNADDRKIGDTGFTLSIASGASSPIVLTGVGLTNMVRFWTNNLVAAGTYTVYAKVKAPDESPYDPNTANDFIQSAAFTFAPQPADITLYNFAVGRSADAGLRIFTNASYTIVNYGTATVTNENILVEYYLSSNTVFGDADDVKIGDTVSTLSMSPGSGWNITLTGTGLANMTRFWTENPLGGGSYYVYARARVIDESPYDPNTANDYGRTLSTISYVPEVPLTVNGGYIGGNISVGGDADWFSFTVTTAGTVTINTQAGTLNDTYMYLYGPNNTTTLIALDDDTPTSWMAQLVLTLNPGAYHVRIRAYSATQTGTYTIGVTE